MDTPLSSGRTPPLGPSLRCKKERPLGTVLKESSVGPDPLPHIRHRSPIAVPVPDLHNTPTCPSTTAVLSHHGRQPHTAIAIPSRRGDGSVSARRPNSAGDAQQPAKREAVPRRKAQGPTASDAGKKMGIRVAHGRPGQLPVGMRNKGVGATDLDARWVSGSPLADRDNYRWRCEARESGPPT